MQRYSEKFRSDPVAAERDYCIVRDFNRLQGMTSPTDTHVQILRTVDYRYVSLENSGDVPVGIAITTYVGEPVPKRRFVLGAGEVKGVSINSIGEALQYIWILDLETGEPLGKTTALKTDSNSFVLRKGLSLWWVQFFHFPSYASAH